MDRHPSAIPLNSGQRRLAQCCVSDDGLPDHPGQPLLVAFGGPAVVAHEHVGDLWAVEHVEGRGGLPSSSTRSPSGPATILTEAIISFRRAALTVSIMAASSGSEAAASSATRTMGATRSVIERLKAASSSARRRASGSAATAWASARSVIGRDSSSPVIVRLDQLPQQFALVAEHGVHRLDGDAGSLGDRLDRRGGVPGGDEEFVGRIEDRPAGLPGLGFALGGGVGPLDRHVVRVAV